MDHLCVIRPVRVLPRPHHRLRVAVVAVPAAVDLDVSGIRVLWLCSHVSFQVRARLLRRLTPRLRQAAARTGASINGV